MDNYKILDLPAEVAANAPQDGILSRTVLKTADVNVILFHFAAGEELSEHTAAVPAILHFLQGEAKLTVGSHSQPAQAGTWVHMAANTPHSIVAETAVAMLLLMVKNS
ncbi:MAG: cupin domain-containing protein [Chloroflexi bacterium]|nr:cupin domain-containing protein [Chloroflexota bacterium]